MSPRPSSNAATRLVFQGYQGVRLVADAWGDPNARPVILLHGGGQTRHAWGGTAATLAAAGWYAIAVDTRGHGDSQWAADGDYSIDTLVKDLAAIADTFPLRLAIVGASLGGLTGLLAAGEGVREFAALVLVDCAPRLEAEGVERIVGFMSGGLDGFASLEEAAAAIASYLPHRPPPKDLSGLAKNLRQDAAGRYRWHWDPKFITGNRRPSASKDPTRLLSAARGLTVPTLLVRGRMSDVVSEAGAAEFVAAVPHAQYIDVSDAGHMVAGDRNDIFSNAVVTFLSSAAVVNQGAAEKASRIAS